MENVNIVNLKKHPQLIEYLTTKLARVGLRLCIDDDGYLTNGPAGAMGENIYSGYAKKYKSKYYNYVSVRPEGVFELDDNDDPFSGGAAISPVN